MMIDERVPGEGLPEGFRVWTLDKVEDNHGLIKKKRIMD